MRIVIDIPEHYIENNIKRELPIILSEDNIVAILPKGHGDLKDVDEIERIWKKGNDVWSALLFAPTVIEADKDGD